MIKKFHNFCIRVHCTDKNLVSSFCLKYNHYAFIRHDKDIYTDSDENHVIGDKKPDHFHILLNSSQAMSIKSMIRTVKAFFPHSFERVEPCNFPKSACDYLTHDTEEAIKANKYRYDRNLVVSDKIDFWYSPDVLRQVKSDKADWTKLYFNDYLMTDGCISYEKLNFYVESFGRDFIFNHGKVKDFCDYMLAYKHREERKTLQPVEEFVDNKTGEIISNPFNILEQK